MVNKILTLFEIEFKRIQKIYFAVISMLILSNMVVFAYMFYLGIMDLEETLGYKGGISLLKDSMAIDKFPVAEISIVTYHLTFFILIGALLWCLYYGVAIWYKDFSNKTKPIYTLFMLPENKFYIFISKLITIITLIYGVIFVQFMCWTIGAMIIKSLTGSPITYMISCINRSNLYFAMFTLPRVTKLQFIMIYILGPILAMTVLFTGIMIHKSIKKIGGLLGILYVISIIMTYLIATTMNNTYTDILIKVHLIFYLAVFVVSMIVSYRTLTKKVYV